MNNHRTQISRSSLNAGIMPKAKEILRTAVMLALCTNQNHHNKSQIVYKKYQNTPFQCHEEMTTVSVPPHKFARAPLLLLLSVLNYEV
jgi:hypothetical protein